ncbi:MAG TPA: PaaI family thioesterase [Baekduia sp.]|nr:PaaI family thioesterase [Baekduia sp.]
MRLEELGEPPELHKQLGIEIDEASPELVRAHFEVTETHFQGSGIVHGGLYALLAESAASIGTMLGVGDDGKHAFGISNSCSFMRPIGAGRVHAVARPIHSGRTTWVWDVQISGDDGKLAAVSRVTLAVR